jgi:hypothetical protein
MNVMVCGSRTANEPRRNSNACSHDVVHRNFRGTYSQGIYIVKTSLLSAKIGVYTLESIMLAKRSNDPNATAF